MTYNLPLTHLNTIEPESPRPPRRAPYQHRVHSNGLQQLINRVAVGVRALGTPRQVSPLGASVGKAHKGHEGRRLGNLREVSGEGRDLWVVAPRPLHPGMGRLCRSEGRPTPRNLQRVVRQELLQYCIDGEVDCLAQPASSPPPTPRPQRPPSLAPKRRA